MSRKIALIDYYYLTEERQRRIRETAARGGFEVVYFESMDASRGHLEDFEIVFGAMGRRTIREAVSCRWFCAGRVGINTICDESLYADPSVILTNSPGVHSVSIAEHLIMCALMLLRKQYVYAEPMRRGEWGLEQRKIGSLLGSRITVLGTGSIGTAFADRARAFRPAVITGIRRDPSRPNPSFDRIAGIDELNSILPVTDILVMCLPETDESVGVLSAERIALLPAQAFVMNIGRGSAVDQDALVTALQEGRLAGAALDVMTPEPLPADHPLRKMDNVILTPHIAGIPNLDYTNDMIVKEFCEDLERYIDGRPLKYTIDRSKRY
jgi:phosphoglycerate dehydrogenase-like enzyme